MLSELSRNESKQVLRGSLRHAPKEAFEFYPDNASHYAN